MEYYDAQFDTFLGKGLMTLQDSNGFFFMNE